MMNYAFDENINMIEFIQNNIHTLDDLLNRHINYDMYISGTIFFMSACILDITINGKLKYRNRIMSLVLLYIMVDNIFDNSSPTEIKSFISDIRRVIESDLFKIENQQPLDDSLLSLHPSVKYYRKMVGYNKNVIIAVRQMFEYEVDSVKFQASNAHNREDYLKMAHLKGSQSLKLLYHIIAVNPTELEEKEFGQIGHCCQLVDDMMDYQDDIKQNIHTIATYEYNLHGNMDQLFRETIEKLDNLSPKYNLIRYGMLLMLMFTVSKYRMLSPSLRRRVDPYIYINYIFDTHIYDHIMISKPPKEDLQSFEQRFPSPD